MSEANVVKKKKGMIRPIGIVVFAAATAVLLLLFYLAAPWLIKQSIEIVGTEVNGAKVELASVDISLSPAGLSLYELQVTDATQPMQNVFEFDQAYAQLDLFQLWAGKVVVEDMSIEALQFGSPRKNSGELEAVEKKSDESSGSATPIISEQLSNIGSELPDAEELLRRHPLQTNKLAEQLDASFRTQKAKWEATSQNLPDESRLKYYEQEFKALTEGGIKSLEDFNQRKQKFDALRAELKQDKATLLDAKEQLSQANGLIREGIKGLKNAPQQDLNSLRQQYSFDAGGALNLSGLLFGNQFQDYADKAWYWYNRLAPLMAPNPSDDEVSEEEVVSKPRGTGRFIHFGGQDASPDFLVRRASANAILSQGEVLLMGKDITHQQYLTGRPSEITAEAVNLNDTDQLNMRLSIDHRTQDTVDLFSLNIKGQQLDDISLSESDNLPLSITQANLNIDSNIKLTSGKLAGKFEGQFGNVSFDSSGQTTVAKEIASALRSVTTFNLGADVGGTLNSPDFDISSDLDKALKNAFVGRFKEKQKEWEAKLKAGLNEKLNAYLAENEEVASFFSDQGQLLDGDLQDVDKLLEKKLDSYVDNKKKEVEDKLKSKLKGLF